MSVYFQYPVQAFGHYFRTLEKLLIVEHIDRIYFSKSTASRRLQFDHLLKSWLDFSCFCTDFSAVIFLSRCGASAMIKAEGRESAAGVGHGTEPNGTGIGIEYGRKTDSTGACQVTWRGVT